MEDKVAVLKKAYRDILGDRPTRMFMDKVENMLDEGCHSCEALHDACRRTEGMVRIFLDIELSKQIGRRWREIVGETAR